jgi:hypothetical protein
MSVLDHVGVGVRQPKGGSLRPKPGISDILAGEAKDFKAELRPYLPQDLIGGSVPHVPGTEEEAVWNAASQACGTEKVHYTYAVDGDRVWYLAAALPGYSEHWDKETVYLYEQEGIASALRWDPETGRMQVFLGAARTILPRVQSMDANFVSINPAVSDVVAWKNRTLMTEKLSRATVRMLIVSGLLVNALAVVVLLFNLIGIGIVGADLSAVKQKTDESALELMTNASNLMQSDTIKHMVRVQDLLDSLALSNGYLVRYEVKAKRIEWEAILPEAYVSEFTKTFNAKDPRREDGDMVRVSGSK